VLRTGLGAIRPLPRPRVEDHATASSSAFRSPPGTPIGIVGPKAPIVCAVDGDLIHARELLSRGTMPSRVTVDLDGGAQSLCLSLDEAARYRPVLGPLPPEPPPGVRGVGLGVSPDSAGARPGLSCEP
jgi:hypothetical protein